MGSNTMNQLIQESGLDSGKLPGTIYTLSPLAEDFLGNQELVEFIFQHLQYHSLDSLRIHEEVIEASKRKLVKTICGEGKDDGWFTWPVQVSRTLTREILNGLNEGKFHKADFKGSNIPLGHLEGSADGDALIVLDGTHRTVSLKEIRQRLGLVKIPTLVYDYYLDNIGLTHWCRVTSITALERQGNTVQKLVEEGVLVKLEGCTLEDIKEENPIPLITCGHDCYTFSQYHAPAVGRLPPKNRDYELSKLHLEVDSKDPVQSTEYLGFEQAREHLGAEGKIVVFPRKLSKMDVIRIVWKDKVFPRKTTRHIFTFRVFNLPIRLSWLRESEGDLWEDLRRFAREEKKTLSLQYLGRRIYLPEDNNRFYEEHMFKFLWEE